MTVAVDLDLEQLETLLGHKPALTRCKLDTGNLKTCKELQNRRPMEVLGSCSGQEFKDHVSALVEDIKARGQQTRIIVVKDENGTLWVLDGHHRVAALKRLRRKANAVLISCTFEQATDIVRLLVNRDVKKTLTKREHMKLSWEAYTNNSSFGKKLRGMSIREAAKVMRVSKSSIERFQKALTVMGVQADLESDWDFDASDRYRLFVEAEKNKTKKELFEAGADYARERWGTMTYKDVLERYVNFAERAYQAYNFELSEAMSSYRDTINSIKDSARTKEDTSAIISQLTRDLHWFMSVSSQYPTEHVEKGSGDAEDDF